VCAFQLLGALVGRAAASRSAPAPAPELFRQTIAVCCREQRAHRSDRVLAFVYLAEPGRAFVRQVYVEGQQQQQHTLRERRQCDAGVFQSFASSLFMAARPRPTVPQAGLALANIRTHNDDDDDESRGDRIASFVSAKVLVYLLASSLIQISPAYCYGPSLLSTTDELCAPNEAARALERTQRWHKQRINSIS
jgi:hypothetical protein